MSVSINNITVSFGGWDLFREISFDVSQKDRIGLVGRNGAGKSTLMKLIVGEFLPSSGSVSMSNDTILGYLPQQMKVKDDVSVIIETLKAFDNIKELEDEVKRLSDELSSREDYESKSYEKLIEKFNHANDHFNIVSSENPLAQAEKALLGLGFKRSDFDRPTKEFSGGWRMRIELVKILLKKPDLLLLDEPTNHLDIESICWLEEYLSQYRGSVLLISHDRKFLDTVTNRTIEIVLGKAQDYKVPYSNYLVLRQERMQQQRAAYENQQKVIKDTEDFIERFRYKPTKSNQVQSRIKMLERIDIIDVDQEDLSRLRIKFPTAPRSGDIVLEVKHLEKRFDDKLIFSDFDLILQRGEKIALVGRNGEGKTTFARMIVGDTPISDGTIKLGHNVSVGYYAQNQDDLMDGDFTVFDTLDAVAVGDVRTRLRDILAAFLFKGEDIDKKVKILSGGERSRLAMARMMLKTHNLLILDEPTNHMDIRSKELLKEALLNYNGTVILVSHDREFLDGLVTKVYEFGDAKVKEHLGGVYEFLQKKALDALDDLNIKSGGDTSDKKEDMSDNKLSYIQRKERDKVLRKIKSNILQIETDIENLEGEIARMDLMLASPDEHNIDLSDGLHYQKYTEHKKNLEELMTKWENLTEELENEK